MFHNGMPLRTLTNLQRIFKEPSIVFAVIVSIVLVNMASLHLVAIDAASQSASPTSQQQQQQQHSASHWFAAMSNATMFTAFLPFRTTISRTNNDEGDDGYDYRYDWSRSTEDNHRVNDDDSIEQFLPSKFRNLRQQLDRSYHSIYSLERQAVQDDILNSLLHDTKIVDAESGRECSVPQTPWIVFTAGVYGAGKTHTIKKLQEQGQFPLQSFVAVDPDEIRRRLPEFPVYVQKMPERAGEMTRKEAGMLAELLTNFALEKGMNVLVDGSLKDAKWYENYFHKLRDSHPTLKIGIIHVTAPVEAILERVKQRGKETGRVVPMEALKQNMLEVPKAVKQLCDSVDLFLEIHNPQDQPHLPEEALSVLSVSKHAANELSKLEIVQALEQRCVAG
ncbi:MAG: hypothetical protein SGILL_004961 [Bacillariaceae sp.]